MSVAVWPSELPKPTRDGYQRRIDDPRIKKSRATGPIGWRRRWSAVSRTVSLSIQIERDLKGVFDQFYDDHLAFGAKPFWMPDPATDGWALLAADGAPLLLEDDTPLLASEQWLCLFGEGGPSESIVGVEFLIAFDVVVMP